MASCAVAPRPWAYMLPSMFTFCELCKTCQPKDAAGLSAGWSVYAGAARLRMNLPATINKSSRAYKHYGTSLDLEQPTLLYTFFRAFVRLNCELIHPIDEKGRLYLISRVIVNPSNFWMRLVLRIQANGFPFENRARDTATTAGGQSTNNDSRRLRLRIPDTYTSRAANSMSDLSARSARAVSSNVLRLQLLSTVYRAHPYRQEGMSNLQRGKF